MKKSFILQRSNDYILSREIIMTKILVVDDEKEIADLIEFYLSNEGYEVLKVNTGKEAMIKYN